MARGEASSAAGLGGYDQDLKPAAKETNSGAVALGKGKKTKTPAQGGASDDAAPAYKKVKVTDVLFGSAQFVLENFYSTPYPPPPPGTASDSPLLVDRGPVYGIERPNHNLLNAVRKAELVPVLISAFRSSFNSSALDACYKTLTQETFQKLSAEVVLSTQVALLFEVIGRKSDIGFDDDPTTFLRYHRTSCTEFQKYAVTHLESTAAQLALEALQRM